MPEEAPVKIAIVTGAGKGIGRETALAIAAEGATVVCVARTQANLDETVQMIEEKGGKRKLLTETTAIVYSFLK